MTKVLIALCLAAATAAAQEAKVTPLMTHELYESPEDVHTVSRNASTTKPAKFLVFFVKRKGAPITVPAK